MIKGEHSKPTRTSKTMKNNNRGDLKSLNPNYLIPTKPRSLRLHMTLEGTAWNIYTQYPSTNQHPPSVQHFLGIQLSSAIPAKFTSSKRRMRWRKSTKLAESSAESEILWFGWTSLETWDVLKLYWQTLQPIMLQGSSLGRFWTVRKCIFNTWQESSLILPRGLVSMLSLIVCSIRILCVSLSPFIQTHLFNETLRKKTPECCHRQVVWHFATTWKADSSELCNVAYCG